MTVTKSSIKNERRCLRHAVVSSFLSHDVSIIAKYSYNCQDTRSKYVKRQRREKRGKEAKEKQETKGPGPAHSWLIMLTLESL